ncbi:MAG: helix-turn-helix domain-containing protein [Acidobacteria bacterium]|nr:helix-turn-helix domain-containing protein [Acidobacteriota bacterium]
MSLAEFDAHERKIQRGLKLVACYMDASTGQRWLTPLQLAVAYGLSRRTVYEMVRRGQLVSFRMGRQLRIGDPGWFYQNLQPDPAEDVGALLSCEVAAVMEVQPQSVRKLARRHRIGYRTVRGRRLYSLNDVRRLLAARAMGHRRLQPADNVHEGMARWIQGKLARLRETLGKLGLQEAEGGGTLTGTLGDDHGGTEAAFTEDLRACCAALDRLLARKPTQAKAIPQTPPKNGSGGLPNGPGGGTGSA